MRSIIIVIVFTSVLTILAGQARAQSGMGGNPPSDVTTMPAPPDVDGSSAEPEPPPPPSGPPPLTEEEVKEGLSSKELRGAIQECLAVALPPEVIWIEVTIAADGSAVFDSIDPAPPDPKVSACIIATASVLMFRETAEPTDVKWPYKPGALTCNTHDDCLGGMFCVDHLCTEDMAVAEANADEHVEAEEIKYRPPKKKITRGYLALGGGVFGAVFAGINGFGKLAWQTRFAGYGVVKQWVHIGGFITYGGVQGKDYEGTYSTIVGIEALHDLSAGLAVNFGGQIGSKVFVGFGLDVGVSAVRVTPIGEIEYGDATSKVKPHAYFNPKLHVMFMPGTLKSGRGIGFEICVTTPVMMGNIDYFYSYSVPGHYTSTSMDTLALWSGIGFLFSGVFGLSSV